jgi:hypothetical protein
MAERIDARTPMILQAERAGCWGILQALRWDNYRDLLEAAEQLRMMQTAQERDWI